MTPEQLAALTEEERETERRWRYGDGPVQRDIQPLLRTVISLRALVEEKDKALKRVQYNLHQMREYVACEVCKHTNETDREYIGQSRQETHAALALTEEEMLKRLEMKP